MVEAMLMLAIGALGITAVGFLVTMLIVSR
jgi:hypothetical protein